MSAQRIKRCVVHRKKIFSSFGITSLIFERGANSFNYGRFLQRAK